MWAHRRGPALGPGALHCPRARSTRAFVPGTGFRRTAELGRGTHSAHGRPGASQGEGHLRRGFEGRRELIVPGHVPHGLVGSRAAASGQTRRLQGGSHCVFARHLVLGCVTQEGGVGMTGKRGSGGGSRRAARAAETPLVNGALRFSQAGGRGVSQRGGKIVLQRGGALLRRGRPAAADEDVGHGPLRGVQPG